MVHHHFPKAMTVLSPFQDLCTTMAVLLHYIYLVVFFLMLAEGIEIGWSMLYVFPRTSRRKWLLLMAWCKYGEVISVCKVIVFVVSVIFWAT